MFLLPSDLPGGAANSQSQEGLNNRTSQANGCQESSLGSHHSRLNPRPPWSGYQPTSLPDLNTSSCSCLLTCFSTLNSLLVVDFQHLLPQTLPQTTLLHSQASVKSSPLHGALHFLSKGDPDRHLLSVLITQPAVCFSIFSTGLEISETVTVIIVCARLDPPSFCREFQYGRHYFFFLPDFTSEPSTGPCRGDGSPPSAAGRWLLFLFAVFHHTAVSTGPPYPLYLYLPRNFSARFPSSSPLYAL